MPHYENRIQTAKPKDKATRDKSKSMNKLRKVKAVRKHRPPSIDVRPNE